MTKAGFLTIMSMLPMQQNVALAADYKHDATICPYVGPDGECPSGECVDKSTRKIAIDNHTLHAGNDDGVWPNVECIGKSFGKSPIDNHSPRANRRGHARPSPIC